MALDNFPAVENADKTGLLAIGGELDTETLLEAYSSGIFPWPFDESFLAWFAPPKRAVLFLEDYHASKRLLSIIKKNDYKIKINKNFEKVVQYCASSQNRKGQKGTWIIDPMVEAYCDFHKKGYAHSVECYFDGELCGGVYGVAIGKMFAGESMFYTKANASQIAFYHLVQLLKKQKVKLLDCQVMTPHSKKFGAVEIKRDEFMAFLKKAIKEKPINFGKF